MADEIEARIPSIKEANEKDLQEGHDAGLAAAMLDRLRLTDARIQSMIKGIAEPFQVVEG